MNEQIRQLAEQAGCKILYDDKDEWYIPSAKGLEKIIYTPGVGLEKFAELLIQKAAEVMAEKDSYYGEWMGNVIKKHFGIKETDDNNN